MARVAVTERWQNALENLFFSLKKILPPKILFFLHISSSYAKILGETNFHTRKWVKSKRRREKKKRGLNDGDNNGQATHGARKHAWRTQAAWAKKMGLPSSIKLGKNLFMLELGKFNSLNPHD